MLQDATRCYMILHTTFDSLYNKFLPGGGATGRFSGPEALVSVTEHGTGELFSEQISTISGEGDRAVRADWAGPVFGAAGVIVTSESFGSEKPVSRVRVSGPGAETLTDATPTSGSAFPDSASTVMRWQMALLSGFLPRFRQSDAADGGVTT